MKHGESSSSMYAKSPSPTLTSSSTYVLVGEKFVRILTLMPFLSISVSRSSKNVLL